MSDDLHCDGCDRQVARDETTRTETMGDLDSDT